MFNENSGLVQSWINLIKRGSYTVDQIPSLSNLREVVVSTLELDTEHSI